MFSKSRINEPASKPAAEPASSPQADTTPSFLRQNNNSDMSASQVTKSKPAASVLAGDLVVTGNLKTTGDIIIEGTVDGDIRAHLLTVGETATIRGEVIADDIVINGAVIGRVRGLKVRLTSSAQVEGDIIHKTIAIESGAHFEGSVQRQDDPLQTNRSSGGNYGSGQDQAPAQAQAPAARAQSPQPQPTSSASARPEVSEAVKKAAEQKKNASNS